MIITYYGSEFIKMQTGDIVLAFNPVGKESSFKKSRFGSDVALVSLDHPDFNGVEQLTYKDKEPFVISGPGEYEVKGVFIKGFLTRSKYAGKDLINTVYTVKFDGINICHLGALKSLDELTSDIREKIGDIDILFVPIAGGDVLELSEASKVAIMLGAKIAIPIHYDKSQKDKLDAFLKDFGNNTSVVDKLTLKKKDLADKEGDIVVLKLQA
ncbi:MAG: MBL fold metallo-hydrolase [Candidatus Pacebacteria bacterium]|nr:MBL fold metallo-hydrolase [Candidatus Paceibacterota bacterium]